MSGHFGPSAEVSFGHFGPKCRSVLPLGPKCLDPRSEVSRPILLNCVERFYLFVSVMPFVCPHTHLLNHIGLFKLHQIFEECYVCTVVCGYAVMNALRFYGCFPVMGSVEACRYRHTVTATPLQHRAQTNTSWCLILV